MPRTEGITHYLPAVAGLLMEREVDRPVARCCSSRRGRSTPSSAARRSPASSRCSRRSCRAARPCCRRRDGQHLPGGQGLDARQEPGRGGAARRTPSASWPRRAASACAFMLPTDAVVAPQIHHRAQTPGRADRRGAEGPDGRRHRPADGRRPTPSTSPRRETIFWNGPMGVFEMPQMAEGTNAMAASSPSARGRRGHRRRRRRLGRGGRAARPGRTR